MTSRPRVSAKPWLSRRSPKSPVARASDYIDSWQELRAGGSLRPVVLYCRVSSLKQFDDGTLDDQKQSTKRILEADGAVILATFGSIETASYTDENMRGRLAAAIAMAKKENAIVVVESTSRLIRSSEYDHRRNQKAQPTVWGFTQLMKLADGVSIASICPPDEMPGAERSMQIKRGQAAKGKKGGRPAKPESKKETRLRRLDAALKLRDKGKSYRDIGTELGVPHSTVQDWVRKYG